MKRTIVFTFLTCACIGGLHADTITFPNNLVPQPGMASFTILDAAMSGINLAGACQVGLTPGGCLVANISSGVPPYAGSLGAGGTQGLGNGPSSGGVETGILFTFSEPVDFEGVTLIQANGGGGNGPFASANVLNCGSVALPNCNGPDAFTFLTAGLAIGSASSPTTNTFTFPSSIGTTFLIQAGGIAPGFNSNQARFGIASLTFQPVPDSGSTLGLLGTGLIGLAGIGFAGKARRKLKLWT